MTFGIKFVYKHCLTSKNLKNNSSAHKEINKTRLLSKGSDHPLWETDSRTDINLTCCDKKNNNKILGEQKEDFV